MAILVVDAKVGESFSVEGGGVRFTFRLREKKGQRVRFVVNAPPDLKIQRPRTPDASIVKDGLPMPA